MDRKKEIKNLITPEVLSSGSFGSSIKSSKSKMMEGLKNKDHLKETFYVDGHKKVPKYLDLFTKKDHNVIDNLKKTSKRSKK